MAPLQPSNRHFVKDEVRRVRKDVFRDAYRQKRNGGPVRGPARALCESSSAIFDVVVDKRQSCFFTGSGGTGKSLLIKSADQRPAAGRARPCRRDDGPGGVGARRHDAARVGRVRHEHGPGRWISCCGACGGPTRCSGGATRRRWSWTRSRMMDGALLDMLDAVGRKVRGREHVPFGGIQMVLSGDFHQLPAGGQAPGPADVLLRVGRVARAWSGRRETCSCMELTTIFRQSDIYFVDVLTAGARRGG